MNYIQGNEQIVFILQKPSLKVPSTDIIHVTRNRYIHNF